MPIKAIIFDFYGVIGLNSLGLQVELNRELVELIRQLRESYKIGLLSNADSSWLRPYLQQHQLEFDAVVISSEVGLTKPERKVFELALQHLGVEAPEAILIDDIGDYIAEAERLGMAGIEYRNNTQLRAELKRLGVV